MISGRFYLKLTIGWEGGGGEQAKNFQTKTFYPNYLRSVLSTHNNINRSNDSFKNWPLDGAGEGKNEVKISLLNLRDTHLCSICNLVICS